MLHVYTFATILLSVSLSGTTDWNNKTTSKVTEYSPNTNPSMTTQTLPSIDSSTSAQTLPSEDSSTSTKTLPSKKSSTSTQTLPSKKSSTSTQTLPSKESSTSAQTLPSKDSSTSTQTLPSKESSTSKQTLPSKVSSTSTQTFPSKVNIITTQFLTTIKPLSSKGSSTTILTLSSKDPSTTTLSLPSKGLTLLSLQSIEFLTTIKPLSSKERLTTILSLPSKESSTMIQSLPSKESVRLTTSSTSTLVSKYSETTVSTSAKEIKDSTIFFRESTKDPGLPESTLKKVFMEKKTSTSSRDPETTSDSSDHIRESRTVPESIKEVTWTSSAFKKKKMLKSNSMITSTGKTTAKVDETKDIKKFILMKEDELNERNKYSAIKNNSKINNITEAKIIQLNLQNKNNEKNGATSQIPRKWDWALLLIPCVLKFITDFTIFDK